MIKLPVATISCQKHAKTWQELLSTNTHLYQHADEDDGDVTICVHNFKLVNWTQEMAIPFHRMSTWMQATKQMRLVIASLAAHLRLRAAPESSGQNS